MSTALSKRLCLVTQCKFQVADLKYALSIGSHGSSSGLPLFFFADSSSTLPLTIHLDLVMTDHSHSASSIPNTFFFILNQTPLAKWILVIQLVDDISCVSFAVSGNHDVIDVQNDQDANVAIIIVPTPMR